MSRLLFSCGYARILFSETTLLSLLIIALPDCHSSSPGGPDQTSPDSSLIDTDPRPYDLSLLDNLVPYHSPAISAAFDRRFALIAYFSELDCQTCVTQELANLKDFYRLYGDKFDMAMIACQRQHPRFPDHSYLRKLKRVGRVKYPIYSEKVCGETGLSHHFSISLIDRHQGGLILQYLPDANAESEWPTFQSLVLHHIGIK